MFKRREVSINSTSNIKEVADVGVNTNSVLTSDVNIATSPISTNEAGVNL